MQKHAPRCCLIKNAVAASDQKSGEKGRRVLSAMDDYANEITDEIIPVIGAIFCGCLFSSIFFHC